MDRNRVEQLLRRYARRRSPERLFSDQTAAALRNRLAPSGRRTMRRRFAAVGLVLAAAVVLVVVGPWASDGRDAALSFQADGAYRISDLFQTARGTTTRSADAEFFVGLRVDRPAYVRLVVLHDRLRLESLPLDRSGALELMVEPGESTAFGGYAVRERNAAGRESTATHFVVVTSASPIEDSAFERALQVVRDAQLTASDAILSELSRVMGDRFVCGVRVLMP